MSAMCVNGVKCAEYDKSSKQPAVAERGPFCGGCLAVAARDIRALVVDHADLGVELLAGGGTSAMDTRVSGSSTASTPLALDMDALARSIAWTLTVWEPPVREFAGLTPERVRGVRPPWVVATAANVLALHVEILASLPPIAGYADGFAAGPVVRDGVYAVRQLRACHRAARDRLGLTRPAVKVPGECSGCHRMKLIRTVGHNRDTVECGHCARRWTYDDYLQYVQLTLESS